ncbi:hypothetical protein Tco_1489994 [Tanacetum coccineum]
MLQSPRLELKLAFDQPIKTSVKKRKRWYWKDLELESDCDRSHLREMYLILNPNERDALETEMRSRDELAIMEVEFVDYKLRWCLRWRNSKLIRRKKKKMVSFLKAVVIVLKVAFEVVLGLK